MNEQELTLDEYRAFQEAVVRAINSYLSARYGNAKLLWKLRKRILSEQRSSQTPTLSFIYAYEYLKTLKIKLENSTKKSLDKEPSLR